MLAALLSYWIVVDGPPRAIPDKPQAFIDALRAYRVYASPDEVADGLFIEGQIDRHYGRRGDALPLWREIVERYRTSDIAEYAANFALDDYEWLGRGSELRAFADELAADRLFLADKPDLTARIASVQRRFHPLGSRDGLPAALGGKL